MMKMYEWADEGDDPERKALSYEFDVDGTEGACWVRISRNGETLLTPMLFSSSYELPRRGSCSAQLLKRVTHAQTDGNVRYAFLDLEPKSEGTGMHASISVVQVYPDGQRATTNVHAVPVNCADLVLPTKRALTREAIKCTFSERFTELAVEFAELTRRAEVGAVGMRMNNSRLKHDTPLARVSVVTAGAKMWQDVSSSAYLQTVGATDLGNVQNFAVCTSNRRWLENGGDPDILVCSLNQTCVGQVNDILPMLQACTGMAGTDGLERKLRRLLQVSIGGHVFGGEVAICHKGPQCVLSPTMLLQKPSSGRINKQGQLKCETRMLLLDTETTTTLLDNPSLLGDTLLTGFSSADSLHLHNTRGGVEMNASPGPICKALHKLFTKFESNELPINSSGKVPGRLETRFQVHALRDFVCAIDRSSSRLLVYQTCGDTYETQAPMSETAELQIRTAVFALAQSYDTFIAFAKLIGKSELPEHLDFVDSDIGNILASVGTLQAQMHQIDFNILPASKVGKQIKSCLQQATDTFMTACAPHVPKAAPSMGLLTAHLAPLRHSDQLGQVQRICLLASGTCNSPTNNRAVVLVQTQSPSDLVVLFVDRHLGTDPEYFSSDLRMQAQQLAEASSVKNALRLPLDSEFYIQSVSRVSSSVTNLFTNKNGHRIHGKRYALFTVKWKTDALELHCNSSTLAVFTSNRVRTDTVASSSIGRVITEKSPDGVSHSTYNKNWRVRLIKTITP